MKYPGKLGEHRHPLPERLPLSESANFEERFQFDEIKHFAECFGLLLDHHQIERGPNAPYALLFALMRAHVPAFGERQLSQPSNRPTKWGKPLQGLRLIAAVENLRMSGISQRKACEKLFEAGTFETKTVDRLERALQEARSNIRKQAGLPEPQLWDFIKEAVDILDNTKGAKTK